VLSREFWIYAFQPASRGTSSRNWLWIELCDRSYAGLLFQSRRPFGLLLECAGSSPGFAHL
jgi:hypothetical protein